MGAGCSCNVSSGPRLLPTTDAKKAKKKQSDYGDVDIQPNRMTQRSNNNNNHLRTHSMSEDENEQEEYSTSAPNPTTYPMNPYAVNNNNSFYNNNTLSPHNSNNNMPLQSPIQHYPSADNHQLQPIQTTGYINNVPSGPITSFSQFAPYNYNNYNNNNIGIGASSLPLMRNNHQSARNIPKMNNMNNMNMNNNFNGHYMNHMNNYNNHGNYGNMMNNYNNINMSRNMSSPRSNHSNHSNHSQISDHSQMFTTGPPVSKFVNNNSNHSNNNNSHHNNHGLIRHQSYNSYGSADSPAKPVQQIPQQAPQAYALPNGQMNNSSGGSGNGGNGGNMLYIVPQGRLVKSTSAFEVIPNVNNNNTNNANNTNNDQNVHRSSSGSSAKAVEISFANHNNVENMPHIIEDNGKKVSFGNQTDEKKRSKVKASNGRSKTLRNVHKGHKNKNKNSSKSPGRQRGVSEHHNNKDNITDDQPELFRFSSRRKWTDETVNSQFNNMTDYMDMMKKHNALQDKCNKQGFLSTKEEEEFLQLKLDLDSMGQSFKVETSLSSGAEDDERIFNEFESHRLNNGLGDEKLGKLDELDRIDENGSVTSAESGATGSDGDDGEGDADDNGSVSNSYKKEKCVAKDLKMVEKIRSKRILDNKTDDEEGNNDDNDNDNQVSQETKDKIVNDVNTLQVVDDVKMLKYDTDTSIGTDK